MENPRPRLIAFYGFIGSGKSYFSKQLAKKIDASYLSSDMVRVALFGNKKHSKKDLPTIIKEINDRIAKFLDDNNTVVLDANLNTKTARDKVYAIAKDYNAKFILIKIDTPIKIIKKRLAGRTEHDFPLHLWNDSQLTVLERQQKNAEPPLQDYIKIDGTLPFSEQYKLFEAQSRNT